MAGETFRKGPGELYSQYPIERTIGNLGEELKQPSDPYANLSQRAIRRCQVNALKAIILDFQPELNKVLLGSVDIAASSTRFLQPGSSPC
jgi:hypothetical protein